MPRHSRTFFQELIGNGRVRINGRACESDAKVYARDEIRVLIPDVRDIGLVGRDTPLKIVYEDDDLLVIDKLAGMVVHPSDNGGHLDDSLVNAVIYHCGKQPLPAGVYPEGQRSHLPQGRVFTSVRRLVNHASLGKLREEACPELVSGVKGSQKFSIKDRLRPGIVHRLDKDTSGLIVVAKNDRALEYLAKQWEERSVGKEYLALVVGEIVEKKGVIEAPIGRSTADRKKMAVRRGSSGKAARTEFETIGKTTLPYTINNRFAHPTDASTRLLPHRGGGTEATLVKVRIFTGRTHQIRVHFASIGHPVVGDQTYGNAKANHFFEAIFGLRRQFLHAHKLSFKMPSTGEERQFVSELPEELGRIVDE